MSLLLALALGSCPFPAEVAEFQVEPQRDYQIANLPVDVVVSAVNDKGRAVKSFACPVEIQGMTLRRGPKREPVGTTRSFERGRLQLDGVSPEASVTIAAGDVRSTWTPRLRTLPGFVSILPPLLAVAAALLFKNALVALFSGVWLGALFVHGFNPLSATARTLDTHIPAAVGSVERVSVVLFTLFLGGMIGIIAKSGSTKALVDRISRHAKTRRSGALTTWLAGLAVFFDDYANCLLVGSTLRPFTDRLRISREKLAYLIDSTAAPIATVAFISTWIGYQLGLLQDLVDDPSLRLESNAYDIFLSTIPYSFYSLLTIFFVLLIASSERDFGPMLKAERRALRGDGLVREGGEPMVGRELDEMQPPQGRPRSLWGAILPVVTVVLLVVVGLAVSGGEALQRQQHDALDEFSLDALRRIIGAADSYAVLLWTSFGGSAVALACALGFRSLRFGEAMDAWIDGAKAMIVAAFILGLAWAMGEMCKDYLQTGPWLLSQIRPSPHLLPSMTFVLCGAVALATGSSFSTMAIVVPIAGPMAWLVTGPESGLDPQTTEAIRAATLAGVLSGSVFGDHCSPISDTTILSSLGAGSDHIDHVRTQIPYAMTCGLVAIACGFLPAGYGVSPVVSLVLGIALLTGVVRTFGQRARDAEQDRGPFTQ